VKKIVLIISLLLILPLSAQAARTAHEEIQRMLDMHDQAMMYVDLRNPHGRGAGDVVGCKANVFKDHCQVSAGELSSEVDYENKVWPLGGNGGPRIAAEWGTWMDALRASYPNISPEDVKWAEDNWVRIRAEQWNDAGNNLIVLRRDAFVFDPPLDQSGGSSGGGASGATGNNGGGGGGIGGGGGDGSGGGKTGPKSGQVGAMWKSRGVQDLGDENDPNDPAYKVKKMADDAAKKKANSNSYIPDDSYRLDDVNRFGKNREEQ